MPAVQIISFEVHFKGDSNCPLMDDTAICGKSGLVLLEDEQISSELEIYTVGYTWPWIVA